MKHKELYVLRICRDRDLYGAVATISDGLVRFATRVHIVCVQSNGLYTIWAIPFPGVPVISSLRIPSIAVPDATAISMQTWAIWRCPKAIIRIEWSQWRYGLSWKTVCHTGRHHGTYGVIIECLCLGLQFKTGSKQWGKKAEATIRTEYIDEALSEFSGYVAADELYDGPFCVLFIVDNHKFKRLCYEVLDHNPTNEDITRFFRRFKQMLDARGLTLKGITTDGSRLYPDPIANVFGQVKHQSCQFHIIREITKDILKVVTQVRRQLKQKKTKRPRGRPCGQQAKQIARKNQQVQKKITELFEHRHLFVKHTLSHKEKKIFQRIIRSTNN